MNRADVVAAVKTVAGPELLCFFWGAPQTVKALVGRELWFLFWSLHAASNEGSTRSAIASLVRGAARRFA